MIRATESVEAIAREFIPTWDQDEDVRGYLVQILTAPETYEDLDSLHQLLLPFVGEESEDAVASMVDKLKHIADPAAESSDDSQREHEEADAKHPQTKRTTLGSLDVDSSPSQEEQFEGISESSLQKVKTKEGRRTKRQERLEKKRRGKQKAVKSHTNENEEPIEDDANAWAEVRSKGQQWGGRGYGGRGEYAGKVNNIKSNVHLSNVTISLPNGADLLQNTTIDIVANHRYALIGRNGVGKSTLLDRLAQHMIPGMPEMRILRVQQQVEGSSKTPLQVLLEADVDRVQLLAEQEELEEALESGNIDATEIEQVSEQLSDCLAGLEAIGADTAETRANEILTGLQFTNEMLQGPTENLSGGWRMRLALAQALFVTCDLLLLDECTNHLDLHGLDWLTRYLTKRSDCTMIIVSHDRAFLDAVCTDVIHMAHVQLFYHAGNYSDFERQMAEKAARNAQILDASERQRTKAEAFVQKQQAMANKKSADPNKQRQAKMIKEKKLDRIGNYREDGKRYKNFSLKQMDDKSVRLAQKVHIELEEPVIAMHFPEAVWPPGITDGDAIIRTESFSFAYEKDQESILDNVTVELRRGSKVALVGANGAGKSTLVKLITGDIKPEDYHSSGNFWRHGNIRVGHVSQYTVEELQQYEDMTVVEYAEKKIRYGKASSQIVAKASGNVRQYLGGFGLGGKHAHQKIGKLSGGERMRLCFATVLADECHLLCLDESTNHVDIETLDSMSQALNNFQGSILMVSHNQAFLSGFCKELWILENGHLTVNHSDTESFDEVFSAYRSMAVETDSLASKRHTQAILSRKATKQRAGARQNTALM